MEGGDKREEGGDKRKEEGGWRKKGEGRISLKFINFIYFLFRNQTISQDTT